MRHIARVTVSSVAVATLAGGLVGPVPAAAQPAEPLPVIAVAASGHDGNVPENTLDGNLGTRWSDQGDGVWIELELDDTYPIGSVDIAWHKGDQRVADFQVRLSTNGSSWETVFDGSSSGTTLQPETYPFTTTSARYVRIVGFGNTQNDWTSITELPGFALEGGGSCTYPGEILDLTNWKITLPIDDPDRSGTQPLEIFQPELETYALNPWFVTTAGCDAVRFRNAVNGVTTPNSSYSRSELREMTDNGTEHASWSSTSGTHTIVVTQAITSLPNDKPHVVAGQIHDSSDDVTVFRLEGSNLYVTDGNDSHHHLITSNYTLGTVFEAKFVVSDGEIEAYYNGSLETTLSKSFSGGYFKAGAYTQANCGNSSPCSSDNYGEVIVYDVTVTHT